MQTYNYGVDSYDLGEGFGHFGIGEAHCGHRWLLWMGGMRRRGEVLSFAE